jgi:hypothetical protein
MNLRLLIAAAAALFSSTSANAMSLDINLSNDNVEAIYSSFTGSSEYGRTLFNAGLLYADESNDSNLILSTGLHAMDLAGTLNPGLKVGIGGQIFFADIANSDVLALGLGGFVSLRPQFEKRLNFQGELYYAPDIVSFLDSESFLRTGARVEYSIIPQADIYVGIRKIEAKVEAANQSVTITTGDEVHFGIKMKF